jgi:hemoglobin-like flavoprotein
VTPEQLRLVDETVALIETHREAFIERFHRELDRLSPTTRALLSADAIEQGRKLAEEIPILAGAVRQLDSFVERARALGARNRQSGVRIEHYVAIEAALMSTLASFLDAGWDNATAAAWHRMFRLMAETMLEGSATGVFRARD